MDYITLTYLHLGTVIPAAITGTWLLASRKGTAGHKTAGKVYLLLMLATAIVTLFMPAQVGPALFQHFGYIHLFSLLALYSVPAAWFAARRGDIRTHRNTMVGLYCGGILIAGSFAFMPGRLLHAWLFG
ncbi:DUF2306 domain-containing protein [Endozoicomonadaceae bacterium StTr2]